MGRSQVKYNQSHGRPGQRGGRGGRHDKDRYKHEEQQQQQEVVIVHNNRNENSWQDPGINNNNKNHATVQEAIATTTATTTTTKEDIEINVMALESYGNYMSQTDNHLTNEMATSLNHYGLDLSRMRQLLVSTLTVAERLKVPTYLISNENDNHGSDEYMDKNNIDIGLDCHKSDKEVMEEEEEEEEDDLNSWLDSVIS